jgi:hypothetical protein
MAVRTSSSPHAATDASSSPAVSDRSIVSAPLRVIVVERVSVSDRQRSLVTSALRSGRELAGKK